MKERFAISRTSGLVIALIAGLSLGACTSSKGNGGAAGSGGSAGSTAGAGGSAAGTSGDAAAGASGGGGSGGGAGMDAGAEMAAAPQLNTCGDPAMLGAATIMMQMASRN